MRILAMQDKHAKPIEAQSKKIAALQVAAQAMAETARRIGHLESKPGQSPGASAS
jgi:hypothetical protein